MISVTRFTPSLSRTRRARPHSYALPTSLPTNRQRAKCQALAELGEHDEAEPCQAMGCCHDRVHAENTEPEIHQHQSLDWMAMARPYYQSALLLSAYVLPRYIVCMLRSTSSAYPYLMSEPCRGYSPMHDRHDPSSLRYQS